MSQVCEQQYTRSTYTDLIESSDEVLDYLMIDGTVLSTPARRLVGAAARLGSSAHADLLRVDICHRIRLAQDGIFAAGGDPTRRYADLLHDAARVCEDQAKLVLSNDSSFPTAEVNVHDVTAEHYGKLWRGFA